MALESTQPLTETSAKYISGGKEGRCLRLTTLSPLCVDCQECVEPQPSTAPRASPSQYMDCSSRESAL